jgi:putative transposase
MQHLLSVGSSYGESNYHLQFTPKYRRDVFVDEEVKEMCRRSFAETCAALGITMVACEFGPDHAHVFVANCKNYAVPTMVQRLKGASSRRIRLELWDRVKDKLWGESFWSGGYFYRSIGSTTSDAVEFYIRYSQKKHWMKYDYEEEQQRQEAEAELKQARLDEF